MPQCVVCLTEGVTEEVGEQANRYTCLRCGRYYLAGAGHAIANADLTSRQRANASGWLRDNPKATLDGNSVDQFRKLLPPSVPERADRILRTIARRINGLGDSVLLLTQTPQVYQWLGISWSIDTDEFRFLLDTYLQAEKHYVAISGVHRYQITPAGHAYLDDLTRQKTASHVGFCAMWFGAEVEPLWLQGIQPAIVLAGYEPKRIDGHQHNNKIDDEIVAMIRRSRFVVADFTGQRGGVYFEAGYAKGLGLEVIWTCRKDEIDENKVHFDNRQYNFVTWQVDELEDFQKRLHFRIEATLGKGTWIPPTA